MHRRFPGSPRSLVRGIIAGAAVFVATLSGEPASAAGIGGTLAYHRSSANLEDTDDFWADLDTDSHTVGFGVAFDTNLAQDRLFNYRLNLSLELVDQDVSQAGVHNQVQGTNVALDQTFGFGFVRTPRFRVFMGPSIHLGVGEIDDEIDVDGFEFDYEETSVTAGIGPELGVNYHLGHHLTFSTSAYARYGVQFQVFDDDFDDGGSDGVFVGDEWRAGLVTSVFFRFGEDIGP